MQKIKDKLKRSFYKLHNVIKKLLKNRKTAIILIFALILIVICITFFTVNIIKTVSNINNIAINNISITVRN